MKLSVVVGVGTGLAIMVFVNHYEGDPLAALFNFESGLIVVGGCVTACLCQFQLGGFLRAIKGSKWLVNPPRYDVEAFVQQVTEWSRSARRNGLLSLEQSLDEMAGDAFARDALQMVIDGVEVDTLRTRLRTRMETDAEREEEPGAFWDAMGGYAPTLGVLGAVMGLIHVMLHLDSGVSALGAGIATAFTATMYGVGLANLVFIPVGKRLSKIAEDTQQHKEMVVEGMVLLAGGASPQAVQTGLHGYIPRKQQKSADADAGAPGQTTDQQQPEVATREP